MKFKCTFRLKQSHLINFKATVVYAQYQLPHLHLAFVVRVSNGVRYAKGSGYEVALGVDVEQEGFLHQDKNVMLTALVLLIPFIKNWYSLFPTADLHEDNTPFYMVLSNLSRLIHQRHPLILVAELNSQMTLMVTW